MDQLAIVVLPVSSVTPNKLLADRVRVPTLTTTGPRVAWWTARFSADVSPATRVHAARGMTCAYGYFGYPLSVGGSCQPCECDVRGSVS
ncbi:hypothetical protein B566_EDAN013950, partial [Ephemera danica]